MKSFRPSIEPALTKALVLLIKAGDFLVFLIHVMRQPVCWIAALIHFLFPSTKAVYKLVQLIVSVIVMVSGSMYLEHYGTDIIGETTGFFIHGVGAAGAINFLEGGAKRVLPLVSRIFFKS